MVVTCGGGMLPLKLLGRVEVVEWGGRAHGKSVGGRSPARHI